MRSRLDLDNYSEISAKSWRIWRNIGQISIDPTRFQPPVANLKPTDMHPKLTRPNPTDWKLHTSRLRVRISPTWVYRVDSELGTNPTQADLWTPLTETDNIIKSFCSVWSVLGFVFNELCVRVTSERKVSYGVVTKASTSGKVSKIKSQVGKLNSS